MPVQLARVMALPSHIINGSLTLQESCRTSNSIKQLQPQNILVCSVSDSNGSVPRKEREIHGVDFRVIDKGQISSASGSET